MLPLALKHLEACWPMLLLQLLHLCHLLHVLLLVEARAARAARALKHLEPCWPMLLLQLLHLLHVPLLVEVLPLVLLQPQPLALRLRPRLRPRRPQLPQLPTAFLSSGEAQGLLRAQLLSCQRAQLLSCQWLTLYLVRLPSGRSLEIFFSTTGGGGLDGLVSQTLRPVYV